MDTEEGKILESAQKDFKVVREIKGARGDNGLGFWLVECNIFVVKNKLVIFTNEKLKL